MDIQIPIYSGQEHIKWPGDSKTDRIGWLAKYCHSTKQCPYCKLKCEPVKRYCDDADKDDTPQYIMLCQRCSFWFGRGTRDYAEGPAWDRFVLGKVHSFPIDSTDIDTDQLIKYLNENKKHLTKIDPYKAEDVVCEILSDYLNCEVKKLGGRKDGGIDGYVLKGNEIAAIIQVKWRQNREKAEGVQVVRDVAGTQIIRNVPRSIIVTTKNKYSKPAREEMMALHERELVSVGKMSMELFSYNDIVSMLGITTRRLGLAPKMPVELGGLYDVF